MSKLLKQTADVDVFDYGKAVALILSQTKELNKTRNTLVDDINYLENRKKQESQSLEHVIAEKAEVLKLKTEVTEKIIAMKSTFSGEVSQKKEELAIREANLLAKESELIDSTTEAQKGLTDHQNELERRAEELDKRSKAVDAREAAITQVTQVNAADKNSLVELQQQLKTLEDNLLHQQQEQSRKIDELNIRESAVIGKEKDLAVKQASLAALAADLENQASLVEREKSKNRADVEQIRSVQKTLYEKKAELDNREVHIHDREASELTH